MIPSFQFVNFIIFIIEYLTFPCHFKITAVFA